MQSTRIPPLGKEGNLGTFRVIRVQQRHERTGRVVTLIDGESMGETKTDLRKRQFTYLIEGITGAKIKPGNWLLSARDDLGLILEVEVIGLWKSLEASLKLVALRVRFDEKGIIRLNETWQILASRPITGRMLSLWQKRMTDDARQYFRNVLPGAIDSILYDSESAIQEDHVATIFELQNQILRRAIQIAEVQEVIRLTSTQLVRATREVLKAFKQQG